MVDFPYISSINHVGGAVDENIIKPVTDNVKANSSMTVLDLVNILVKKEPSFTEGQTGIAGLIREDVQRVQQNPDRLFLGIWLRDPEGNERTIPEQYKRLDGEGKIYLNPETQASGLFERYQLSGQPEYMGIHMVCAGVVGGGR